VREGRLVAVPFAEPQLQQRLLQVLTLQGRSLTPLVQAFVDRLVENIVRAGNGMAPGSP
jgi:DNA-binding transcriptional LysR family regulator